MPEYDSIRTRSSLLGRVRDPDDDPAWRQFAETYRDLILRLARSAGLRPDEAEEVLQEVLVGVCRNIGSYQYDRTQCSFKHWLSQLVRWRIGDQFRKRSPIPPQATPTVTGDLDAARQAGPEESVLPELEAVWETEWREHLLARAIERLKRRVRGKQFQAFFLYVVKAMPVREVMRRLQLSRGQVYLAKFRVGPLFREELKRVRQEAETVEPCPGN